MIRANYTKQLTLGHLHPNAGLDLFCKRCGAIWEDFAPVHPHHVTSEPAAPVPLGRLHDPEVVRVAKKYTKEK